MRGTKSERKAYLVYLCLEMPDCGVLERRQAINEEIVANATTTDRAGSGARRHFDVDELLNGGINGFDVVLVVVSLGRLAFGDVTPWTKSMTMYPRSSREKPR